MTVWVVSIIDSESGYESVDCVCEDEVLAERARQEILELYALDPPEVTVHPYNVIER